jgi:hypothetical protein
VAQAQNVGSAVHDMKSGTEYLATAAAEEHHPKKIK